MSLPTPPTGPMTPEAQDLAVDRLRERIYVTFTTVAVIYTLNLHPEGLRARGAVATVAITAIGTVLATAAAEVIAHIFVHGEVLGRREYRRIARIAVEALGAIVPALIVIALAGTGWWTVSTGLTIAGYLMIITLGLIVWLGVRRSSISPVGKLVAVVGLAALGLLVVALKSLAH